MPEWRHRDFISLRFPSRADPAAYAADGAPVAIDLSATFAETKMSLSTRSLELPVIHRIESRVAGRGGAKILRDCLGVGFGGTA